MKKPKPSSHHPALRIAWYTSIRTAWLGIFGTDDDIADYHATKLYYKWLWVNNPNWPNERRTLGGEAEAALQRADKQAIGAYLKEAQTVVEKLLEANWQAVEAIAEAILEYDEMTAQQVRAVLDDAGIETVSFNASVRWNKKLGRPTSIEFTEDEQ